MSTLCGICHVFIPFQVNNKKTGFLISKDNLCIAEMGGPQQPFYKVSICWTKLCLSICAGAPYCRPPYACQNTHLHVTSHMCTPWIHIFGLDNDTNTTCKSTQLHIKPYSKFSPSFPPNFYLKPCRDVCKLIHWRSLVWAPLWHGSSQPLWEQGAHKPVVTQEKRSKMASHPVWPVSIHFENII